MRKWFFIIGLLSCMTNNLFGQATTSVGAVVETNSHLWKLEEICRYPDSLTVKWEIRSKLTNSKASIDMGDIYMTDYRTHTIHKPLIPLARTFFQIADAFDIDTFRIAFPAITDSIPLISIHLSSVIKVDSILLPPSNMSLISEVRYKIPSCKKSLKSRRDSILYSDSLFSRGMMLYGKEQFKEAIPCFEKCFAFDKQLDHYNNLFSSIGLFSALDYEYSDYSRVWLACCYYKIGRVEMAKSLDGDYMLEPFDRKLVEKSDSIHNMLNSYSYKPTSMETNLLEYIKICKMDSTSLGANHHRYALSLYDLGRKYSSYRLFSKAKESLLQSYNIITSLSDDNYLGKWILNELAKVAYEEEDYVSAIRYLEKCLKIKGDEFRFSEESFWSGDYSRLANYYRKAGKWEKALFILKNKMLYWKTRAHEDFIDNFQYTSSVSSYASLLATAGRFKEALRVYNKLETPDLSTLGGYYYDIRDYQNAVRCYQKALNDSSSLFKNNCLNSLAICYNAMGNTEKAIQIQKECIGKTDPSIMTYNNGYNVDGSYITFLSNLASFFNLNEQYDSALVYERKSLELKEKCFSPHSEDIAYSYMNIGIALGGKGELEKAIDYLLFSLEIYKKERQMRFYHRALSYLSKFAFALNDEINLNKYISEHIKLANEDLISTFQELTYGERSRYIEEYSDLTNREIPYYAYYTHSDSIIESAYNASLMMKGALLNSENNVKAVIEDSKDAALKDLWEELRADKYILSKQLEKDSLNRLLNTDSLQNMIYNLEDSLIVRCKAYDDITKSMKLKWQDIQESLSTQDVAIEFVSFPIENDSVMYVALTLRKDDKSPKLITLFEENQLKIISDTLCYNSNDMTLLVWGPLLPELRGVKNIYFSPSGALYNIGIEYLPGMEDYNIYRLSSTRELVNRRDINENNHAVLYGGLDYDAKLHTLSQRKSRSRFDEIFVDHSDIRSMKYRGGQENLTHTLDEVEQIEKELNNNQWVCLLDTLSLGTEESFKFLSGKKIKTLHIATHGFYYTPEESDNMGYSFLLPNEHMSAEDKSLSRSGLLMSGANHILEGDSIPEDIEDGILTAKEIADVDLRGLDLVVLSACQTGLGDISQGEGVFGLQRGFKKAGVNSILMSLWDVNDEATQILMTQFYKNHVSGQSKRQSLRSAQRYLREYNAGQYNKPEYWAAFILLDGIDKN